MNSVLKRPMFMRMGGGARTPNPVPPTNVRPTMAPQNTAPPPRMPSPTAPVPSSSPPTPTPDGGIGALFSQKTDTELRQAQNPEQLINALRGNQLPLEARYEELAGYVGPQDAGMTPESVLAMVQPTIMMTPEGAANSGIGRLVEDVANIPVEDDMGVPTPAGRGIASMAMNSTPPPPIRLRDGGELEKPKPRFGSAEEAAQFYRGLQISPEELEKRNRRDLAFAIAKAGLGIASDTSGQGLGTIVAEQAMPVLDTYSATRNRASDLEQSAKMQGAEAYSAQEAARAQAEYDAYLKALQAETKYQNDLSLEEQRRNTEIKKLEREADLREIDTELYEFVLEYPDGTTRSIFENVKKPEFNLPSLVSSNTNDEKGAPNIANVLKVYKTPTPTDPKNIDFQKITYDDGSVEVVDVANESAERPGKKVKFSEPATPEDLASLTPANMRTELARLDSYIAQGADLAPEKQRMIETALVEFTKPSQYTDPDTQRTFTREGDDPELYRPQITKMMAYNESNPDKPFIIPAIFAEMMGSSGEDTSVPGSSQQQPTSTVTVTTPEETAEEVPESLRFTPGDFDAFGGQAQVLQNIGESIASNPIVAGAGISQEGIVAPEYRERRGRFNILNRDITAVVSQSSLTPDSRAQAEIEFIRSNLPNPEDTAITPSDARQAYEAIRVRLRRLKSLNLDEQDTFGKNASEMRDLRREVENIDRVLDQLDALLGDVSDGIPDSMQVGTLRQRIEAAKRREP